MWGAPFTMAQKAQPAMRKAYFEHHRGVRSARDDPAAANLRDLRAQQDRLPRTLSRSRDAHHEALWLRLCLPLGGEGRPSDRVRVPTGVARPRNEGGRLARIHGGRGVEGDQARDERRARGSRWPDRGPSADAGPLVSDVPMSAFTEAEIAYLSGQRLRRPRTSGP